LIGMELGRPRSFIFLMIIYLYQIGLDHAIAVIRSL